MTTRYLISIATYRRPDDLVRLLDSLAVSVDRDRVDVVVVDNDAAGSARDAATSHELALTYVVEEEPGIASARNRGLQHFGPEHHGIIFVDDDEWVGERWFETLTSAAERTGGVVSGPVYTVLPDDAPRWMVRGGFYQRPALKDGQPMPSAATNNTLLLRSDWEAAGSPRFDTAFSTTGGSDIDFFWGLRQHGIAITHVADADVYEDVPPERLTWKWLRRRLVRNGIVNTRVRLKHGQPVVRALPRGLARVGYNAVLLAWNVVRGRGVQAKPLNAVLHEYGKVAGLLGQRVHEYKRS